MDWKRHLTIRPVRFTHDVDGYMLLHQPGPRYSGWFEVVERSEHWSGPMYRPRQNFDTHEIWRDEVTEALAVVGTVATPFILMALVAFLLSGCKVADADGFSPEALGTIALLATTLFLWRG